MNVIETDLPGVLVIQPAVHRDQRGFFLETWHSRRYADAGLPETFVQDNHSLSAPQTVRGLHYQLKRPQGKLVRCVRGGIFDVAVDIRRNSPTFGRWVVAELNEENKCQLWVPPGFAHGFCVLREPSDVLYKCTDYYDPNDQHGVSWNDPHLEIPWPIHEPVVSKKDSSYPPLSRGRSDLPES